MLMKRRGELSKVVAEEARDVLGDKLQFLAV
jgi:hypothetical protein